MIFLICKHLDLGLEGSCVCMCTSVILGKTVERSREGKEHSCGKGEKLSHRIKECVPQKSRGRTEERSEGKYKLKKRILTFLYKNVNNKKDLLPVFIVYSVPLHFFQGHLESIFCAPSQQ